MKLKHRNTLKEHKAAVYALCKGQEEHIVFSAGSDQHVIQWNIKTLQAEKVVAKSPTTVISLLYLKGFNYLLIGQIEGGVHVIDLAEGKEIKYLKVHQGYVFDMHYLEEKRELVVASGDGTLSIWSMDDFKLLYQPKLCSGKIRKLSVSFDGLQMVAALGGGAIVLLNTKDWSVKQKIEGFQSSVNSIRFYPQENKLLVGEKDALLHAQDLNTGIKSKEIAAHYWAIYDIQFSPDGNYFATASRDKTVKIWNIGAFSVLKRFEGPKDKGHTHSVNKLLWMSYENLLISTGDDGALKIWDIY